MLGEADGRRLRRVGGAGFILLGLAYLTFLVAFIALASLAGSSTAPDAQLLSGGSRPWLPRLFAVLIVIGQAALVPGAIALYLFLAPGAQLRRGLGAIGLILAAVTGVVAELYEFGATDLAVAYTSASSDTARTDLLAAWKVADAGVTDGSLLWVFLFSLGVLFFGSAMLGPGRSRLLAYLSLVLGAAGVFGFVGGSVAPPLLGLSFAVYFISIFWNLAVGITLYRSPAAGA